MYIYNECGESKTEILKNVNDPESKIASVSVLQVFSSAFWLWILCICFVPVSCRFATLKMNVSHF